MNFIKQRILATALTVAFVLIVSPNTMAAGITIENDCSDSFRFTIKTHWSGDSENATTTTIMPGKTAVLDLGDAPVNKDDIEAPITDEITVKVLKLSRLNGNLIDALTAYWISLHFSDFNVEAGTTVKLSEVLMEALREATPGPRREANPETSDDFSISSDSNDIDINEFINETRK